MVLPIQRPGNTQQVKQQQQQNQKPINTWRDFNIELLNLSKLKSNPSEQAIGMIKLLEKAELNPEFIRKLTVEEKKQFDEYKKPIQQLKDSLKALLASPNDLLQ